MHRAGLAIAYAALGNPKTMVAVSCRLRLGAASLSTHALARGGGASNLDASRDTLKRTRWRRMPCKGNRLAIGLSIRCNNDVVFIIYNYNVYRARIRITGLALGRDRGDIVVMSRALIMLASGSGLIVRKAFIMAF